MANEQLKIQEKIEDMIDYAEDTVQSWPPLFQKTLGTRILNKCYEMSDQCESANNEYYKKTTKIRQLDEMNRAVQRMVRRANRTIHIDRKKHRRELLNLHKYLVWSGKLTEIGKMIGGWIEWSIKHPPSKQSRQDTSP